MPEDFPCTHPGCHRTFKRPSNRTQHYNTHHRSLSPDSEPDPAHENHIKYHPKLNALPCDKDGNFLPPHTRPPPPNAPDATDDNMYHPFEDRLAFDWGYYHFAELQSSEREINKGLDLWLAASLKAGEDTPLPWSSAEEMYRTIDAIQEGDAPFETIRFKYAGPIRPNPPAWMTETYELCTRNSRTLLHHQLATTDFASTFTPRPYRQFDHSGDRVWSNLMSGDWAWNEADTIAQDERTHGAMLVPIISGSDKTTVSVATGHQEYHPVYESPGPITNTARRAHGNAVLPVAFLPIPKTNKRQRKRPEYQRFVRQMYHMCLARIFAPLRSGMTVPEVVCCPDGHFRRAIYTLGPYIADYPEQVWLAGIVQGWCPKCEAKPDNLDDNLNETRRRKHERTDFIIKCFDPGIVWENYGIRSDVVPFTHGFPRADIHVLLTPDLLHQLIKGSFKDHLVTWVNDYLHIKYGEARALEIIHDIDRRISAVPSYAGLRRFSEGRDFAQWTGDDSKALMKVYIAAIAGHVPSTMVQCISAFMELCYIFRRNVITASALATAEALLRRFHELRHVFIAEGVRESISLPRQHALSHYLTSITLFGSPNGLCSSITESKHIKAVKEPWRRSSRFRALIQMLRTIIRMEKLAALRRRFLREGLLRGSTAAHFVSNKGEESELDGDDLAAVSVEDDGSDEEEDANQEKQGVEERLGDAGPENGPPSLSSITLAATPVRRYPKDLNKLAQHINEPDFPSEFKSFLYSVRHPKRPVPDDVETRVNFTGKIYVFHSAISRFYAPSDLCGPCGMYRQRIRCNPSWYGHPRNDTAFVVEDENLPGMQGMHIARVRLLFSFTDYETNEEGDQVQCALVSWFVPASDQRDPETGMWTVKPEGTRMRRPVQVIPLKSIARGAHLLPKYGVGMLPDHITHVNALDAFQTYFVNPYIDHHCHEFLSD
ncbi:hypothetical protein GALMADRAFT_147875 [Galerina marginata CBS 339.88]|uniref:C2H2-type domain-containing protein n=1 Tax=Galerina marginata (strain CBS 339.88) TaxID=685588 RepID=A0A067S6I5_GALM3|nr:hypothetical protein GALMADRAFT_147875 [Galerina marginata CBS 339.88]